MRWADLDTFTRAYCEAAIWTGTLPDTNGESLDAAFGIEDMAPEAIEQAARECDAFRAAAGAMLAEWEASQAGHDFSLTRNGHGAGFWDRGLPHGEALSELARKAGERDLYPGDDGQLYFSP